MTFIVQNTTNDFDAIHRVPFATQEEAEQAARDLLSTQPGAVLRVAQVLKVFRATVTVTEAEPETSPALLGGE